MHPCHPEIERVMQEQVCQNRADDTPLRGSTRSLSLHTIIVFHWRRQPSFDIKQRPFARHVLPDGPQQELVVNVVEQTFECRTLEPNRISSTACA